MYHNRDSLLTSTRLLSTPICNACAYRRPLSCPYRRPTWRDTANIGPAQSIEEVTFNTEDILLNRRTSCQRASAHRHARRQRARCEACPPVLPCATDPLDGTGTSPLALSVKHYYRELFEQGHSFRLVRELVDTAPDTLLVKHDCQVSLAGEVGKFDSTGVCGEKRKTGW